MPNTYFDDALLVVRTRRRNFVIDLSLLVVRATFVTVISALLYSVFISKANAVQTAGARMQSLASLRAAAEAHVRDNAPLNSGQDKSHLFIAAAELDARLQMPECPQELNTFTLNASAIGARNVIGVRCNGSVNWTVYVPVNVESDLNVFVMRRSLPRDAHLTAADLQSERRRVAGFGNIYVSDAATLSEQHLKRPINTGTVLTADFLARDLLVKRGQQVLLVVAVDGLAIQAPGLALGDGGASDRIRVQNQMSLKIIEGVVENGNMIRVGM